MLPHWLRHTYREVTWSGPQQGLIGIPYWEQHQFVIADLGTVRFLDVWSFSGETILVLSNNLDQHSPRVLVCLQWSSAVNWFAILLSGVSVKDLYRDHFTVWYVSKSSAVCSRAIVLDGVSVLEPLHSSSLIQHGVGVRWSFDVFHLSGLYWCICIFVVLDFVYLYLLLSSLLKELFHISSLMHQYECEIFTTMVQTMSLSSNTGMHGSTPDKVTGAFVIVYMYLYLYLYLRLQ